MLRRHVPLLSTKALSPYAQALKHVALRGASALGPSAKEHELLMYRGGSLPADYRPPVQGKWDDTIERWAYSWQFPAAEEEAEYPSNDVAKSPDLPKLVSFCRKLLSTPPSKLPGSAASAGSLYLLTRGDVRSTSTPQKSVEELLSSTTSAGAPEAQFDEAWFAELEKQLNDTAPLEPVSNAPATSEPSLSQPVMPATQYAAVSGVPAAYLDDGSQQSAACKELCAVLEDSFQLTFEEPGIQIAMGGLVLQGYLAEAKALMSFARDVGLGPTAEMYRELMRFHTRSGEVNESMALIEAMKEDGITPRVGNWHELMRCFHAARDYPAVQQVVNHMKAYANIEPTEVTFALQLRALAKDQTQQSALYEAVQLFDQMENVYGYLASRPHYHALMQALSQSVVPEMRLRCEELGRKMELLGMTWDGQTFLYQIMSAQVVGDLKAIERLFGKMRNEGIPMTLPHLTWAIHGHTEAMARIDFAKMREANEDATARITQLIGTCFGIYELALGRGWQMDTPFVNALLRQSCQAAMLVMEHCREDVAMFGHLEKQSASIWESTFTELSVAKDAFSYHNYIALLAHGQRLDEAEKLFQEMCLREDMVPLRRTYEALIFAHISSGEEGGTARALHYLEAMERAKIPIRASLIKKIVKVQNAAGYTRDMKRRARRIMQAREEYMARKEEGVDMTPKPYKPPERDEDGRLVAVPLPVASNSALAWWDKWKRESINKHELFESENADGSPKGETFKEKNDALKKMGIESKFLTKADVPDPSRHKLLPKLRAAEGEVTGALWGLDGGELSYPSGSHGPQGWGVRLWRDRRLIQQEYEKATSGAGGASLSAFSTAGIASRNATDQVLIEDSGVKTPGELRDLKEFPDHRYDDGTPKPLSEFAVEVPPSAELVWQQERKDALAPYKTDEEISVEADSTFQQAMEETRHAKIQETVTALKLRQEDAVDVTSRGTTRRSKHDYLEKWREMYRHGTLEVPDEPLERYGLSAEDSKLTLSNTIRGWYARNKKTPASEEQVEGWKLDEQRGRERSAARKVLSKSSKRRR